jgi:hypothetical protein
MHSIHKKILYCIFALISSPYSLIGSPYTMQVSRETSYEDLQKLILKEMAPILHDDILTSSQPRGVSRPYFRRTSVSFPFSFNCPGVQDSHLRSRLQRQRTALLSRTRPRAPPVHGSRRPSTGPLQRRGRSGSRQARHGIHFRCQICHNRRRRRPR